MAQDEALPQARATAPTHIVPNERIVSIEHPCIVKNFDNGFKSLGGEPKLRHAIMHKVGDSKDKTQDKLEQVEPVVGASLRPKDPSAKRIDSTGILTRNVLVKVSLPKRTGRKRKRGSDEPFVEDPQPQPSSSYIKAPELLQRLRETEGRFTVKPLGMIPETHRFRRQPDYQLRTDDMPAMRYLEKPLSHLSYSALRDSNIDIEPSASRGVAFPLPMDFTQYQQPLPYEYKQALSIRYGYDENGNEISYNTSWKHGKTAEAIPADAKEVPTGPPPGFVGKSGELAVQRCANDLGRLLDKRPLVTARVAVNTMKVHKPAVIKDALPMVGYMFSNGAWRDVIIKYGVDPRSDPKYRFYQPLMFQLDGERIPGKGTNNDTARIALHKAKIWDSHVFDGTVLRSDGRTWQVCDITDPMLYDLLHKPEGLSSECHVETWGWYKTGVIQKVRTIMKDKIRVLQKGEVPIEEDYQIMVDLPEALEGLGGFDTRKLAQAGCNEHQIDLMRQYRILMVQARYLAEKDAPQPAKEATTGPTSLSAVPTGPTGQYAAIAPKPSAEEGQGVHFTAVPSSAPMDGAGPDVSEAMIDPRLRDMDMSVDDATGVQHGTDAIQGADRMQAQDHDEQGGTREGENLTNGENGEDSLFVT